MSRQRGWQWEGPCPKCGRLIALLFGSGPYAQGRGDTRLHKAQGAWCPGGYVDEDDRSKRENFPGGLDCLRALAVLAVWAELYILLALVAG